MITTRIVQCGWALVIAALLAGCFPKYIDYPGIHRIADDQGVDGLTAWTLEQTDARTILNVLGVLQARALGRLNDPQELMSSYKTITSEVAKGWPNLEAGDLIMSPGESVRERVLEQAYKWLAIASVHEHAPPELRLTYLELRPAESHQPEHELWLKYARKYGLLGE